MEQPLGEQAGHQLTAWFAAVIGCGQPAFAGQHAPCRWRPSASRMPRPVPRRCPRRPPLGGRAAGASIIPVTLAKNP